MVATLFAKYKVCLYDLVGFRDMLTDTEQIELVNPRDTWKFTDLWFVRQTKIVVTLKERLD